LSCLSSKPRPVLLPLGWPTNEDEREAFARLLLATGADVERMLDPPGGAKDSFLRHATRMPFLQRGREIPIVALVPADDQLDQLLEMRRNLIDALPTLVDATWLVYVADVNRPRFQKAAIRYGGLFDAGGGITTWHLNHGVLGLVGKDTWLSGLASRLEDLLASTPESGVVPIEPPCAESTAHCAVPTTEPAPPSDAHAFDDAPAYAAVSSRIPSPRPQSYGPGRRLPSSAPPNPHLRRR
jgi:hypothetical protein